MIRSTIHSIGPAALGIKVVGRASNLEGARKTVQFDDLNLSYLVDVKVLYRRIRAAAESICLPLAHTHRLAMHKKWCDCRSIEVAKAVAEIDHPGLREYHRQLTSRASERGRVI